MKEKNFPTLRECWADVKSAHNLVEWLSLLVPRPVNRAWDWVRHPRSEWRWWRKNRWVNRVRVGDVVCDCRGEHSVVAEVDDLGDIVTENGWSGSLLHCCTPVMVDGSCHDWLNRVEFIE